MATDAAPCRPADGLAGLLKPLDETAFLRDRLGVEPVLVKGLDERFTALFGWDVLNEALAAQRADPSRMHLVRASQGVSLASCAEAVPQLAPRGRPSRLVPDRLQAALEAGATLAVDGAEELHAPLRELVAAVERSLRCLVQANLYVNLGGAEPGFHTHWDDHDVIVLQCEGAKHWDVYAPTIAHPVGVLSDPPPPSKSDVAWSGLVERGDLLYLPRGWWHTVKAIPGSPSAHLSLSARLPSTADLLRRLLARLAADEPVLRRDLPRFTDGERWYAELRTVLTRAVSEPGLLEKLAADLDSGAPDRPRFRLPQGGARPTPPT
ncbi:cupin domain-containing protein [Micromonospora sp. WMMD980]|uniref:JmjC domain-containing protein n=1 Tax=Micromonospora sp. WMMD980 TaxID=3016088 RepID=UPI002416024B|nr:cupin domain-containing protein [Micromonospora sp. WMMD980]MDG4800207.1 cupin domain-containing protein [Micromonospora sp. WMMD980]